MKGTKKVTDTIGERLGGGRSGPFSAAVAAVAVGGAVAVTVYRALRS